MNICCTPPTRLIPLFALAPFALASSFEALNVDEGRSLYFIQPDGISQIFSRVTGNSPSNILGTLGVQQNGVSGSADLYLLNPNGILLGPNAQNADDIQLQGLALLGTATAGDADAGQLQISSDRLRLEDGAIIATSSGFGRGDTGEISIQIDDLLVSGGSIIATNTTGEGNAGTFDAFGGTGGNVETTTQKNFGIEPQEQATEQSDITASSKTTVDETDTLVVGGGRAGNVIVNEISPSDPGEDLAESPQDLLNETEQISTECSRTKGSSFIITGRGGLPQDPRSQLGGMQTLEDWREQQPAQTFAALPKQSSPRPEWQPLPPEAQGLRRDRQGRVHLLAYHPERHSHQQSADLAQSGFASCASRRAG